MIWREGDRHESFSGHASQLVLCAGSTLTWESGRQPLPCVNRLSKTAKSPEIQFTATGTFSAAPITVTPLPVDWSTGIACAVTEALHALIVGAAESGCRDRFAAEMLSEVSQLYWNAQL